MLFKKLREKNKALKDAETNLRIERYDWQIEKAKKDKENQERIIRNDKTPQPNQDKTLLWEVEEQEKSEE